MMAMPPITYFVKLGYTAVGTGHRQWAILICIALEGLLNWIYALHSSEGVVDIPDIPCNRMITTCFPSLHRQELLFSLQDNLATPLNILYLIFLSLSTISPIRISTIKVLYTSPQQEIQPNPSHPYSHRLVFDMSLPSSCPPPCQN